MATTRTRRRVGGRPTKRPQTNNGSAGGGGGGAGGVRFVRNAAEDARLKRLQDEAKAAAAARATRAAEAKAKGQPFLEHGDHRTTHQHKHPRPPGQPDDPVDDVVIVLRGVQRLDRNELAAAVINEVNGCTQYSARRDPYSPRGDRVCRLWANREAEAVLNLMAYPKGVQGRGVRFPTAGVAIPGRHGGPIYEAPKGMVHLYEYSSDDDEGAPDGVHPNDVGTQGKVSHVFRGPDGTVEGYQLAPDADPWGDGRGEPAHFFSNDDSHTDWDSDPGVHHPPPGVGAVDPMRTEPLKKKDGESKKSCKKGGKSKDESRKKTGATDPDASDSSSDPPTDDDNTTARPCSKGGKPDGKAPPGTAPPKPPQGAPPKKKKKKKRAVAFAAQDSDSASSLEIMAQPPPKKSKKTPDEKGGKDKKKEKEKEKEKETEKEKEDARKAKQAREDAAALLPGTIAANKILAEYKRSQQKKGKGWLGGLFGKK